MDNLCAELLAWAAVEKKVACHSQGYNVCIFCWGYLDDDLDLDGWDKGKKYGHKPGCLHLRAKAEVAGLIDNP